MLIKRDLKVICSCDMLLHEHSVPVVNLYVHVKNTITNVHVPFWMSQCEEILGDQSFLKWKGSVNCKELLLAEEETIPVLDKTNMPSLRLRLLSTSLQFLDPFHFKKLWSTKISSQCEIQNSTWKKVEWCNPADNYMFTVNNKDTRTTPMASFWCLYC